jgi:hypothetical protein
MGKSTVSMAILCWFYREEYNITITGWWFQTLILFPFHINGMSDCHPNPIDEVIIFQRGWLKPPSSTCHEQNSQGELPPGFFVRRG